MYNFKKLFYFFFFVLSVSGCDRAMIDPDTGMNREEFQDIIIRGEAEKNTISLPGKATPPNISRLLVAPPPPPMGNGELISFAVTEEVPIKDILIELGRLADVDIEVDPTITGGIILKVTNKPLDVVVKRISDLANLRYTYTNNILRFETDTPYTKSYNVDFLIENEVWDTIETSLNSIVEINRPKNSEMDDPRLIVNRPASIISVYASEKTQRAVDLYIQHVKTNYAAQVLIEAKVVEVALNDNYKMGIDWSFLNGDKGGIAFTTGALTPPAGSTTLDGITANIKTAVFGGDLSAAINALQEFGLTKTLSSPRVHAMNNQKSELKFVNKLIYFNIEKEEETSGTGTEKETTTTYTSTKQEEDVGVTMTIIPSINLHKNEITLNVIPELKVKIGDVVDPVNELNKVPVVQSRSVSTSLKIQSGNVLVIGGLMSEESTNEDRGVPFLSGVPVLGFLFKSTTRTKNLTETVIFIKATIIKPDGGINSYDRDIYNFVGNKDSYL